MAYKKKKKQRKPRRPSVDTVRHRQIKFRLSDEEYDKLREKINRCKMTQQDYLVKCVRKAPIYDMSAVQEVLPLLMESHNLLAGIDRTSDADEVRHAMNVTAEAWDEFRKILRRNNATK